MVLIAAYILHLLAVKYIDKLVRRAIVTDPNLSKDAEKKREVTLIKIIHRTFHVLLIVVAGMMVMSNLGLNVGPLLAAAGIAGLALGFGGQYLIKDVISGLFIILENQYRIADVVCIGGKCGLVEDITLRMTTLRDLDGTVHHVPHGEIKAVSNLSKHYSRVNLNVRISYSSSLEKVISVVNRVGEELANDPDWKEHIIKPPQFLRVDDFADSAIVIKILGDTKPIKQWDVTGELRKRLKIAFDKEGIEIPLPQRVVHYASE
ncbi:MAG TPA: mechanosensitive ion channel family protein [Blastocatellia bacterium]|nr:mechanosensitive ion channel family protein [Blastocatellia bacterium]